MREHIVGGVDATPIPVCLADTLDCMHEQTGATSIRQVDDHHKHFTELLQG